MKRTCTYSIHHSKVICPIEQVMKIQKLQIMCVTLWCAAVDMNIKMNEQTRVLFNTFIEYTYERAHTLHTLKYFQIKRAVKHFSSFEERTQLYRDTRIERVPFSVHKPELLQCQCRNFALENVRTYVLLMSFTWKSIQHYHLIDLNEREKKAVQLKLIHIFHIEMCNSVIQQILLFTSAAQKWKKACYHLVLTDAIQGYSSHSIQINMLMIVWKRNNHSTTCSICIHKKTQFCIHFCCCCCCMLLYIYNVLKWN